LTRMERREMVVNAAHHLHPHRRRCAQAALSRRASANDRSRQTSRMLTDHGRAPPAAVRDRRTTARPNTAESNGVSTAQRLVSGTGVGDRADRDRRQSIARWPTPVGPI
jgi:hypothetical protein